MATEQAHRRLSATASPARLERHTPHYDNADMMQSSPSKQSRFADNRDSWDAVRNEAKRLESILERRIEELRQICQSADMAAARGVSSTVDSVEIQRQTSAIEGDLQQLQRVNERMEEVVSRCLDNDPRKYTLGRHKDVRQELLTDFRRVSAVADAAKDRSDLLGPGSALYLPIDDLSDQQVLLRERGGIQSSIRAIDGVLEQAGAVSGRLASQGQQFKNMSSRAQNIVQSFPVLGSLLNAIKRRKQRNTLILGAITGTSVLFLLVYVLFIKRK